MNCPKCGEHNYNHFNTCAYCGQSLDPASTSPRQELDGVPPAEAMNDKPERQHGSQPPPLESTDVAGEAKASRGRTAIGIALLIGALFLGFGAWSTYTSPFITFGAGKRVALSDIEMKELEQLTRPMGGGAGGQQLSQLFARINADIRVQRRTVALAAGGSVACFAMALFVLRRR
jgi:hypothetical protein